MKKFLIIITLSIIACANAVYLTYQSYAYERANELEKNTFSSFCDVNNQLSCTRVLQSPYAKFFGMPFPALAMVVYPVLALVALLGYLGLFQKAYITLFCMSVGGACFNGYYIYQEAVHIGAFCLLCLLCSGIILTIAWLSFV